MLGCSWGGLAMTDETLCLEEGLVEVCSLLLVNIALQISVEPLVDHILIWNELVPSGALV
ncbi:hypothetical protein L195_g010402 [Trifolium pratense]|uniref:Uncharacterized protein n=1 Tax=Trifolium pratense TaxID=57577 RepID=A0A2K3PEM1_TRIPR|nr:hypothetical protein L195_g010402 [Trifolium pratense]